MRGRPSSSRGTSSKRAMRPVPSLRGRAPTSCSTMATDSPCTSECAKHQQLPKSPECLQTLVQNTPHTGYEQAIGDSPSF